MNRWKMHKLGFLNFWLYDQEEFLIQNGHLLLRGVGKIHYDPELYPVYSGWKQKPGTTGSLWLPGSEDGVLSPWRRGAGGVYRLSVSGI